MGLNRIYYKSVLALKNNSSTILTFLGAAGVVVTTVVAVKDTPKAIERLEKASDEKGGELSKLEMVYVAGPVYIPSVICGVSTIACILGANVLNKKKQESLTAAYALIDSTFKGYRSKVKEVYGEDADNKIVEEIARDVYKKNDIPKGEEILFFDFYSMRYFESSLEEIKSAEYEFNRLFILRGHASLNEFYEFVGLPPIDGGERLGWSVNAEFDYGYKWIDFDHHWKTTMEDGLECYILSMPYWPHSDYLDF